MYSYEINDKTMAIIPSSNKKSYVIEEQREFYVDMEPIEIIGHSCEYYGSTLNGRNIGTTNLIGFTYKRPIIIEETNNIIFFPTESIRNQKCCWLALDKIESYNKINKDSLIKFKTGYELIINISCNSLENQVLRSALLDSIMRKRRKIS